MTGISDPGGLPPDWPGAAAVVQVSRERAAGGRTTSRCHYDLSSYRGRAATRGRHIRGHWGMENELHWALDVAFREDSNRTRAGNAGAKLGLVRRIAASVLKQVPAQASIKARRFQAALDEEFLLRVLQGFQGE